LSRGVREFVTAFDSSLPSNRTNNSFLSGHNIRPCILAQREPASEDHKHHEYNLLGKRSYPEKTIELNYRKSFYNPYIMEDVRYDNSGGCFYAPVRSNE
jgi:hypothetical protein